MDKIKFLKNHQIDYQKWDNCVDSAVNGKVYAFSWYLDIVAVQWSAFVYGDYKWVFPVVFKKYIFITRVYHPLFCQQLGPFSRFEHLLNNDDLVNAILKLLKKKYSRFTFSINNYAKSIFQRSIVTHLGLSCLERINLELDLSKKYEQLYSNYSTNTKRNLKSNDHFYIKNINQTELFVDLFKKHVGAKVGLKSKHYLIMQNLITVCIEKGIGILQGYYNTDNILLGGLFIITTLNRHILLFNFSNQIQGNLSPMSHLINAHIKVHCQTNVVLDFEGSSFLGVQRFYKGFGAVEKNYIHITK